MTIRIEEKVCPVCNDTGLVVVRERNDEYRKVSCPLTEQEWHK